MNATEWEDTARARLDAVIEQIMAWGAAMTQDGRLPPAPAQVELLRRIYEEELPLARLMDRAHLAVHAEGPGAAPERLGLLPEAARFIGDEDLLRQALEALLGQRGNPDWQTSQQRDAAIAALRERLGEGEQQ